MAQDKRARATGRRGKASFVGFPRVVAESEELQQLSGFATKLLFQLNTQYKGHNNGDLSCEWSKMLDRGWNSKATLNKARKELLELGFIVQTRVGYFPNTCSLYAVTWQSVDPCKDKHDHPVSKTPLNLWRDPRGSKADGKQN